MERYKGEHWQLLERQSILQSVFHCRLTLPSYENSAKMKMNETVQWSTKILLKNADVIPIQTSSKDIREIYRNSDQGHRNNGSLK